ncbi:MAG: hypothetical protein KGH53_02790, partial [Candidatus Micrarchaeota archaeon]|nr:hypothetical protein [Candidatus Micrarchaeota archaeon]
MASKPEKQKATDANKRDKGATSKLEEMGKRMVGEIKKGDNPRFVATTRTRSNIIYDKKNGYLRLGTNEEERSFLNVA